MDQVTITHYTSGKGGEYVAEIKDSEHVGRLQWDRGQDGVRIATHTLVPPEIGGRGIAAQLVERMVADARKNGFRIAPRCSYVADKFDKNPGWSDLRA